MPICSMNDLLAHAVETKYAVGAFLSKTLEMVQATIMAAEESGSPVAVRIHPKIRQVTRLETLGRIIRDLAADVRVPVAISLDHGMTISDTVDAVRAGCTSVMLDAADEPLEENIRRVKPVVEFAKPLGIMVEAGLGNMEHGLIQTESDYASVADAVRLVSETGATILSPAVGNVHGTGHGQGEKPQSALAIYRIRELHEATGVPICLHGGSGIPADQMRQATKAGVALVIIYSDVVGAYDEGLRSALATHAGAVDILQALIPAQAAAKNMIRRKMGEFGSEGQSEAFWAWRAQNGRM